MNILSLYSENQKFKVYSGNQLYSIADNSISTDQYVSVDDGGQFTLANGDILYINEKYGPILPEDERYGIKIELESGHFTSSYLIIPGGVWQRGKYFSQQSGYGVFYDLNQYEYEVGNYIRVYDLAPEVYDGDWQYYHEDFISSNNLVAVIYLEEDNNGDLYWHLVSGPQYYGSTVEISEVDTIIVSGVSVHDGWSGPSVHFELESGNSSTAYYVRNGECVNHSSNGWFGINPEGDYAYSEVQEGDEIHIYSYTNGDDYTNFSFSDYADESALDWYLHDNHIEYVKMKIIFSNGQWVELSE